MTRVSAILLNYRRAPNVRRIIALLERHPAIDEIIVWNNNPDEPFRHGRATVIDAGRNFLCIARYAAALLARNEAIYFQDDDILVPPAALSVLLGEYERDPGRIYGQRGKNLRDGVYGFSAVEYGEVDIILGQVMLFSKRLLASVYGDILALSPFERGDDIAFSLLCGRKHLAIRLDVRRLGHDDMHALWRQPGHFQRRQEMVDRILASRSG